MKLKVILFIAALATIKASASPTTVTISGTQTQQGALTTSGNNETLKTTSTSLKSASLYNIISNAVANVGNYGSGITPTNLPANGYIVYDLLANDGTVGGAFYVTNKSGFYYPLSGTDMNGNYYSFAEFDTYYFDPNNDIGTVDLGFGSNTNALNGVATETFNTSTGNGTVSITAPASFMIHDNPYAYDSADNAGTFYSNTDALAINGNATINLTYNDGNVTNDSVTLSGMGAAADQTGVNSLVNGTVTFGQGTSSTQSGGTGGEGTGGQGTGGPGTGGQGTGGQGTGGQGTGGQGTQGNGEGNGGGSGVPGSGLRSHQTTQSGQSL